MGYNSKNRDKIVYPDVLSVTKPVPHGPELPISLYNKNMSPNMPLSQNSEHNNLPSSGETFNPMIEPRPFKQKELNDLVRDLGLSKDAAELLGSRLKEKNLLDSDTILLVST